MNGIDTAEWNPETDPWLPEEMRYTAASTGAGKALAKQAFQERFQLQLDPDVPLFACIGRLTDQKGIDVLLAATPDLLMGSEMAPLGSIEEGRPSLHLRWRRMSLIRRCPCVSPCFCSGRVCLCSQPADLLLSAYKCAGDCDHPMQQKPGASSHHLVCLIPTCA
jgi:hypothetical protein